MTSDLRGGERGHMVPLRHADGCLATAKRVGFLKVKSAATAPQALHLEFTLLANVFDGTYIYKFIYETSCADYMKPTCQINRIVLTFDLAHSSIQKVKFAHTFGNNALVVCLKKPLRR